MGDVLIIYTSKILFLHKKWRKSGIILKIKKLIRNSLFKYMSIPKTGKNSFGKFQSSHA